MSTKITNRKRDKSVDCQPMESFTKANERQISALYQLYLSGECAPFFIDIAGPYPFLTQADFYEECTDLASLWVETTGNTVNAYFLFFDIQKGLSLSNLDFGFFGEVPLTGSKQASDFGTAVRLASVQEGITRMQMLAFVDDLKKIQLAQGIGFGQEGVLREHFYYSGKYQDLVVLGKSEMSRYEAIAS
jgi:hypothetical protein